LSTTQSTLKKIQTHAQNPVILSAVTVMLLSNMSHFINYLIQIILGRGLSNADYGLYNSVTSLGSILGAASQVVPIVVSKDIANLDGQANAVKMYVRRAFKLLLGWGAVFVVGLSLATPWLSQFLKISDATPILVFVLNIYFYHLLALFTGTLYGLGRYSFATALNFAHALLRLLLTWIAVKLLGGSYLAAIAIWSVCNIVIWLWKMAATHTFIQRIPESTPTSALKTTPRSLPFILNSSLTWVILAAITNLDMVLVKHRFDEQTSGFYATATIIARIAFFLPQAIAPILIPEVIRKKSAQRKMILFSGAIGSLIAISFTACTWISPEWVIGMLFGSERLTSANYLPWVTLAMALAATVNILMSGLLALENFRFLTPSFVILGSLTVASIVTPVIGSPNVIAQGLCLAMVLIIILLLYFVAKMPCPKENA
jgi:O-antigen/teichoic acid export membrane protein